MTRGPASRSGVDVPLTFLRESEDWGLRSYDLAAPPRRFWADDLGQAPPAVEIAVDAERVRFNASPSKQLTSQVESWPNLTRRSLARLRAHFLITEDPQRRLDARAVNTLAHQVSLVRHVLDDPRLARVLIADEVGLGKTVEAGLLIQELIDRRPGSRVLYLAPARLVNNVRRELDRLGLRFRQWTAVDRDARLSDQWVVASIHRAVHGENSTAVLDSGPWDVLVVDECHHLSDWEPGGGDPRQNYKLVRDLIARQSDQTRVILLSGTPHQGHSDRFENLLRLLVRPGETIEQIQGRVVYRTKDDVTDWDGNPLFPQRQVNEPLVFDFSANYSSWLQAIHRFFKPEPGEGQSEASRRAGGWRCAQALQWAASSPQAGLGYLVRQAVRARWTLQSEALRAGIAALRPYRMGSANEPVEALFERLQREVGRQESDVDLDDIEDFSGPLVGKADPALEALLLQGLHVVAAEGHRKWDFVEAKILRPASPEKVVLFAQPIETVTSLCAFLERTYGERPALVIGGQKDADRQREIDRFLSRTGARFLVSSRAGGEGINLQVARRLVHIDVPWNPMELEQRVGRVHRFGSRQTILVDTIVAKGSREEDAYRTARNKLQLVASTMVAPERFESLFSRVMCLIPPEELQGVMANEGIGPISDPDRARIGQLVQEGFAKWQDFHKRYAEEHARIRQLDPGLADWAELGRFLEAHAGATTVDGFSAQMFALDHGDVVGRNQPAKAIRVGTTVYACGDYSGVPVLGPDDERAAQLGLNLPEVAKALRRHGLISDAGAAHLRWPSGAPLPLGVTSYPFGVIGLLRQTFRVQQATWTEINVALQLLLVEPSGRWQALEGEQMKIVYGHLIDSTVRTKPEDARDLVAAIGTIENETAESLRRITKEELDAGVRYSVLPLFAAVVGEPA